MIRIDDARCVGCGACVPVCPFGALSMVDEFPRVDEAVCTFCGSCVDACPVEAISIEVKRSAAGDVSLYSGVWVFAEQHGGEIHPAVFEMLGAGRRLADDLKCDLSAVLLGEHVADLAPGLFRRGADSVIVAEHAALRHCVDDLAADVLVSMVNAYKPEVILAGATVAGRAVIPRAATLLGTGLTADCTELAIEPETGHLLQTRPAFGGNIMARIRCEHRRPQMATVRPNVMDEAPLRPEGTDGELIRFDLSGMPMASKMEVVAETKRLASTVNLADAEVIVAGGRGMKSAENFDLLQCLASVLGGQVAATRSAVDEGWIGYDHQVGQTGKVVKPGIYFAVGISGAVQHVVGMDASDVIIAVNKDPNAPIFQVADYGLVGDFHEIVPALIEEFRKLKN